MAKKEVKGQGSVVQLEKGKPKGKCLKWQLRISTGRDSRTGKYLRKTRVFEGTYSAASKALREFIDEVENNKVNGKAAFIFEENARRFLEMRSAKKEVAETTIGKQEWQFKATSHHIGHVKLEDVAATMLDEMYVAMMQGDTLSGKRSGGSYVNQIHDNITLVFQQVVNERLIDSNPCDKAHPPKMDTKPKKAIHPDKVRELVAKLDASIRTNALTCSRLRSTCAEVRSVACLGMISTSTQHRRHQPQLRHEGQSQRHEDQSGSATATA